MGPCSSVGCLQTQSSRGVPVFATYLSQMSVNWVLFDQRSFLYKVSVLPNLQKHSSPLIFQGPFNFFFSDLLLHYLIFSELCFYDHVVLNDFLYKQTERRSFSFCFAQTLSSTCRIKVMTFVSGLLTAWKIYHLGIASTEISKPGDKISTLLSIQLPI